jgi:membrane protein
MIDRIRQRIEALRERFFATPLGQFIARYDADRADDLAVLIAWTALFSLFPLILGLLAILGLLLRDPERLAAVQGVLQDLFPAEASDLLTFLRETREVSGLLGIVGLVSLLWAGSALFTTMAMAFNRFYGVPMRTFLRQRLMALTMIFVFFGLMLVSLVASALATAAVSLSAGFVRQVAPWAEPLIGVGTALVGWALSLGAAFLLFLAIYRVVPNVKLALRDVWPGALLAAVLFVLLLQVWPLYVRFLAGGLSSYATLGVFLLLVSWLWLLARIVVLGALLNAFRYERAHGRPAGAPAAPEQGEVPAAPPEERAAPSAARSAGTTARSP